MEQIKEAELKELAEAMFGKAVHIIIKGDIEAQYIMRDIFCAYSRKKGTFFINGRNTSNNLLVYTSFVCMIKANKERDVIEIYLDGVNSEKQQIRIEVI